MTPLLDHGALNIKNLAALIVQIKGGTTEMTDLHHFTVLKDGSEIAVSFVGPPLSQGPLPAVFYFSLSADESLTLDPYNQPVIALKNHDIRIFSLTLPGHGNGCNPKHALTYWAQLAAEKIDFVNDFVQQVVAVIDHLIEIGAAVSGEIGVAGLSRGAFMATHVAAKSSHIPYILGFAPLTSLSHSKDFAALENDPFTQSLSLFPITNQLVHKSLRFYMGNLDTLVHTHLAFEFTQKLVLANHAQKVRAIPVELMLIPSIGLYGHGTAPETFEDGAKWMAKQLRRPLK